jgi:hypothetical protein
MLAAGTGASCKGRSVMAAGIGAIGEHIAKHAVGLLAAGVGLSSVLGSGGAVWWNAQLVGAPSVDCASQDAVRTGPRCVDSPSLPIVGDVTQSEAGIWIGGLTFAVLLAVGVFLWWYGEEHPDG